MARKLGNREDVKEVIYSFDAIDNEQLIESTRVMFITGSHDIFNNMLADKLKRACYTKYEFKTNQNSLLASFGIASVDDDIMATDTRVDFTTFMDVKNIASISGKWFCSVDIKTLTKKQIEILEKYMVSPSKNGTLAIIAHDFMDYRKYLRNETIRRSVTTNLVQLSFPRRTDLYSIVTKMFNSKKVSIGEKAVELFVFRMSDCYDDYEAVIDKICIDLASTTPTYAEIVAALKGIENYVIDDFILQLLQPTTKVKKIRKGGKLYKMLKALLLDLGARRLCSKLRYKIQDYLEMRALINKGIVPPISNFTASLVKPKVPDEYNVKRKSNGQFRKIAAVAFCATTREWLFMLMILNSVSSRDSEETHEKVLYELVGRNQFSTTRLLNIIGVSDIVREQLYNINIKQYTDEKVVTTNEV